ncbi:MAG: membrane protein insertion efficiency factor YidD [Alphaproteobacteria bacterium]
MLRRILILFVRLYQKILSPILSTHCGIRCRFSPSCSTYALTALTRFGALKGFALTIRRFSRCHPFGGSGYDPVPEKKTLENRIDKASKNA